MIRHTLVAGMLAAMLLAGCSARPAPIATAGRPAAPTRSSRSIEAGGSFKLGDTVALRVPTGYKASWIRDARAAEAASTSVLPQAVETAQFNPVDDANPDITIELYATRSQLDSFAATYRSIVDRDGASGGSSRQPISVARPGGLSFSGYARGVPPVGGGPAESIEIVLFSDGPSTAPLRVAIDAPVGSALLGGTKDPARVAGRLLATIGL